MLGSSSFSSSRFECEKFQIWNFQDNTFEEAINYPSYDRSGLSFPNYDTNSDSYSMDGFTFKEFSSDFLTEDFISPFYGKLDDNNSFDATSYNEIDLHDESDKLNSNLTKKETPSSIQSLTFKSWSSMSKQEQENSLRSLSEIACRMGIREQLNIIRMMDPHIEISSDMKEFPLDVSLINDSKWKQIQDYFKQHTITFPPYNTSSKSVCKSQKSKPYKTSPKKSFSADKTSRKQKQKKIKELSKSEELEKLKRKIAKQSRKEERSGLFVYEKVVKCSVLEEDEDVNILE